MEVEINEKKYNLREVTYLEALEIEQLRADKGIVAGTRKLLEVCAGLSDDEISKLSLKDGAKLQEEMNKLNDLGFQKSD